MTNAIDTQLIANMQNTSTPGTILWPMIALSNIAQGSSVLAMSILQKKNERAKQVNVPACISCYLGVTEPALFGVNLKYGFPLVCGMIGSAIAAMISVGFGVRAVSIGVGGLPGILSIYSEYYLIFLAAMAVAIVVPFVLTFIIGKAKLSKADLVGEEDEEEPADTEEQPKETAAQQTEDAPSELKAVLSGRVIPLEEVPDDVFSQHIMGDGVAIEPTDNTVVAPADATVSAVMEDSRHACGLTLANGTELLIHVGIDTVDMNGDGFELFVKEGDKVKCNDPLIRFDPEKIKSAGHPTTTIFLVTDEGNSSNIQYLSGMDARAGETAVIKF